MRGDLLRLRVEPHMLLTSRLRESARNSRFPTLFATLAPCLLIAPNLALAEPWRLAQAAAMPDWFSISGVHRMRYETLDNQFRAGETGGDQMLALRTTVLAALRFEPFSTTVELIDSRAALDDAGTPLNTTLVNPAELLQGYVAWHARDLFASGTESTLRAGRLTFDMGSRRLVARNEYRNTINAFTGVEWRWRDAKSNTLQMFYTLPVDRQPTDRDALRDNDIEFDDEGSEVRFWGIYYGSAALPGGLSGEVFLLGLDESDAPGRASRNRDFLVPGLRVYRPSGKGKFDYLLESALEIGEARASTRATDQRDLDHFAHNLRLELGYSWAAPWSPRLNAEFDLASGDDNPADGDSGSFDPLFGARRLDFGPTGIYGAFARSNIVSPGLRVNAKPYQALALMVAYRGFWLHSKRDAWSTSGVVDASGQSGRFIGQQIEARLRVAVVPKSIDLEFGVAALFAGHFARAAPNSSLAGDPFYAYSQVQFEF